jgi:glucose/mannose-6-phosphate isomerase
MMDQLVARFPAQLREALLIAQQAVIQMPDRIDQVYIAGMGGSAIGGDFVRELVRAYCPVPVVVGKGYDLPHWVGPHTLAIVSSYSGNTEETLTAYALLCDRQAHIVAISSGGMLREIARDNGHDHISVPDDWPSPRACLGYSLVQQLNVLIQCHLAPATLLQQVAAAADLLEAGADDIRKRGLQIAQMLHGKTPVIYTTDLLEAVAVRFRQQLNENAKILCWHHVVPEMNHNELVGWRDRRDDLAVFLFRYHTEHPRNKARLAINKEIVTHYTDTWIEVFANGDSLLEQAMYHVHLGDWISVHLADMRGMDAVEVRVIDFLKQSLAE